MCRDEEVRYPAQQCMRRAAHACACCVRRAAQVLKHLACSTHLSYEDPLHKVESATLHNTLIILIIIVSNETIGGD